MAVLLQIQRIDGVISSSFFDNVSCACGPTDQCCYVYVGQYEINSSGKIEISGAFTVDQCQGNCSVYTNSSGLKCWAVVLIGTQCILYTAINENELKNPIIYKDASDKKSYIRTCVNTSSPNCVAATASVNPISLTTGVNPISLTTGVIPSGTAANVQTTVQATTNATGTTTGATTKAVTVKKSKPLYLVPCLCPDKTIKQTIEEIIEEITINPKNTSKANHLLISASDSRLSAVGIGTVAVVVMVLPLAVIVFSDLHSFVLHVFNVRKTTRKAKIKA